MTLSAFLEHWSLAENPFRAEEARQDPVFTRLASLPPTVPSDRPFGAIGTPRPGSRVQHPDFEKIVGDFGRPSTAIVFGEKGSGKTAIRLQLAEHIASYNASRPGARVLLLPYDELNTVLDRLHARVLPTLRDKRAGPADTLRQIRLADHLDGLFCSVVPRVVDALLDAPPRTTEAAARVDLGKDPAETRRTARALDKSLRRDMLCLQAVYDRAEGAEERTAALRRRLGLHRPWLGYVEGGIAYAGWLIPLAILAAFGQQENWRFERSGPIWTSAFFMALGVWLVFLLKKVTSERFGLGRQAKRLRKQIRVAPRSEGSYRESLRELPPSMRTTQTLPVTDSDDQRYAMLGRLLRVLAPFGYTGLIIVVDRVDEPTLVSGDPDKMRSVVWPMLNNKFLQQEDVGVKLLLPIELRHLVFRESAAFFQEARLDKQCTIERLAWSGPMLYDLCNCRLNAVRPAGAQPISLTDLFAEDVARADIIDALDQMHHPRDAFKLLYQALAEHCSNVTTEDASFKIPKALLDSVKKHQVERVRQLYMGVRPA